MYPIITRYGPFFLYSYTVVMGLGVVAAIGLTIFLDRRAARPRWVWLDGLLVGLIAGLVGGRIVFVALNWGYYQENVGEILLVTEGGLSYYGVLIAGLAAFWLWARRRSPGFDELAGLLAPALALASAFGWLACWLEGCAYGRETFFGPWAADLPDSYGVYGLRFQTQLFGLAACLLVLGLILLLRRHIGSWRLRSRPLRPVLLFWLTLMLLSLGRLAISFFRGDDAPMVGMLRLDSLADGVLIGISSLAICLTLIKDSPQPGKRDS